MATNHIIVDGTTGGTNVIIEKVITQTIETSDAVVFAEPNRGYVRTSNSLQTVVIPSSLFGDTCYIQGKGSGLFRITQVSGQQILYGDKETVVGVTGYVESIDDNDAIFLKCTAAPATFTVIDSSGNFNMNTAGGVEIQNAVNNLGGSDLNLTSTGNNVQISGTYPNIDLNRIQNIIITDLIIYFDNIIKKFKRLNLHNVNIILHDPNFKKIFTKKVFLQN